MVLCKVCGYTDAITQDLCEFCDNTFSESLHNQNEPENNEL